MEAEKISLRPRPIAPKPVMILISQDSTVPGMESTQELSNNVRLPDLPSIDEIIENAVNADGSEIDEMKVKDETSPLNETDSAEAKDNEDDIAALVVASSNVRSSPKGRTSNAARKKSKHIRDVETSLSLLLPDSAEVADEKAFSFAQAYFMKVKEKLEESDSGIYQQFLETLNDFGSKIMTVCDLYKRISSILHSYPDLASEFVVFLLPEQAMQCGKLMEYLILTKMKDFFRRLEICFKRQPQQLRKIYTALTGLSTQTNVTMNAVRSTILPLLKGNSFLTESFLEIMPQGHLPDSLMTDFDEMGCIEVDSDNSGEDDHVETLIVPDLEDKYGSDTCICQCHNSTKQKYRSRIHHCVPCGTKFIHGRVFMQIGKILRPAKVIFLDSNMAACIERLSPKQRVKKNRKKGSGHNESSSVKEISPSKPAQNVSIGQQNIGSQSDISNVAVKNVAKSRSVKQRAVNKNCKIHEHVHIGTDSIKSNFSFAIATRNSRSGTLKICIKVPKLNGEKKSGNNTLPKKGSLKRQRSSSRNRVRQKSIELADKSLVTLDKRNISDAVDSTFSVTSNQDKSEKFQTSPPHKQPAKKQCKLIDNVSLMEASVSDNSSMKISPVTVSTCSVSYELQLPRKPFVVSKRLTTSSEATANGSDNSLHFSDILFPQKEDTSKCENSIVAHVADITLPSQNTEEHLCKENENVFISSKGGEPMVISDCTDCLPANFIPSQIQECTSSSETPTDFSQSYEETRGRNNRDHFTSDVCSSESRVEDVTQTSWTKEEDKVILKMFQQECATERILYMICQKLPQRSVEQIQKRFQTLMNLLQKMTGVRIDDDHVT